MDKNVQMSANKKDQTFAMQHPMFSVPVRGLVAVVSAACLMYRSNAVIQLIFSQN